MGEAADPGVVDIQLQFEAIVDAGGMAEVVSRNRTSWRLVFGFAANMAAPLASGLHSSSILP